MNGGAFYTYAVDPTAVGSTVSVIGLREWNRLPECLKMDRIQSHTSLLKFVVSSHERNYPDLCARVGFLILFLNFVKVGL